MSDEITLSREEAVRLLEFVKGHQLRTIQQRSDLVQILRDRLYPSTVKHDPETRRVPMQASKGGSHIPPHDTQPGTISWKEHVKVWEAYSAAHPGAKSAEEMAVKGFAYGEVEFFLGHEPETFIPDPN